eukprot:TRINITY_DN5160_c0_g1_i1.p1 TRINITY_DN5160_c0_g1~~TRINITY_DN5160_c0_g1_i1.p1  ORF type:complete len:887 (-),score=405.65 TRINITY_DN5160_c0_g1_i1:157-2604(-)
MTEDVMGKKFGAEKNALLLSIRSGARVSMPGMMDTVLNLGLNDASVKGLAEETGNERFAFDCYRRFIMMYANVVESLNMEAFEHLIESAKVAKKTNNDTDLTADDWKTMIDQFKIIFKEQSGHDFPQDPIVQLWGAIAAVFRSWNNKRAIVYRRMNNIADSWGTAVNVQTMVFGNKGESSATGVAFTRDPSTGENYFFGEWLRNAQGEDVVAGIRTPQYITKETRLRAGMTEPSMEEEMPEVYKELECAYKKLEAHYHDMQDIEFTVEDGKLFLLQTRSGKRTGPAAVRMAVEMEAEGLIDKKTAVLRVDPTALNQLLHPRIDPKAVRDVLTKGLPASPGAAVGKIVFTAEDAVVSKEAGVDCILVRLETSPEDITGMAAAKGILTARGGMTSHAAVVARGMGCPCVSGAGEVKVVGDKCIINGKELTTADSLTLNGSTGEVMMGALNLVAPDLNSDNLGKLMSWADSYRTLKVRANADTVENVTVSNTNGAEGIGLCRTEHMFFDPERINVMRQMILSGNEDERKAALQKLIVFQRTDYVDIFRLMPGKPITIRLLDPPLHEFLPEKAEDITTIAKALNVEEVEIHQRIKALHEENPMLGHRGCRLGITESGLYEMQAQAVFEAAFQVQAEGINVAPEVMIPLVCIKKELEILKEAVVKVYEDVKAEKKATEDLKYMVGTMIELPRAALTADELAEDAEFFSFGTNDLTQTTLGMSRDDAGTFLPTYSDKGIFPVDPFQSLDQNGVGKLVKMAADLGRKTRPGMKLGICGEHGGEPESIDFCHRVGLDYVSCSPFRVPIARLAAAQAAIRNEKK